MDNSKQKATFGLLSSVLVLSLVTAVQLVANSNTAYASTPSMLTVELRSDALERAAPATFRFEAVVTGDIPPQGIH
jgi:hypothetical protein